MILHKKYFIAFLICLCSAAILAQETADTASVNHTSAENTVKFKDNISLALLWKRHLIKESGILEMGFPIYKGKKHFFIRGNAMFEFASGYNTQNEHFFTFAGGLKFMFGGKKDREKFRFVTYGFFAPQFGGGYSNTIDVGKNPTYVEMAGGAAFEFYFTPGSSFFLEYGGGTFIPLGTFDEQRAGAMLTLGHRYFLN